MAPRDFREETSIIISCLFQDERDTYLETDGPEDDDFDAAAIAAKLRELGDHYDETVIQPLIKEVQTAAKDQVLTAFSNSVETLCKTWVAERPEVTSEKQLLKASITLALYVKKNCPDMTGTVQNAMNSFVNNRLANWIIQQGGWEQASSCWDSPSTTWTVEQQEPPHLPQEFLWKPDKDMNLWHAKTVLMFKTPTEKQCAEWMNVSALSGERGVVILVYTIF